MADTSRHGDWRIIDDLTGFEIWASESVRQWNGLRVHRDNADYRHPQEFVRGRPDRQKVPFTRPEPPDVFLEPNEVTRDDL